jgi:hypothetical protein
MMIGQKVPYRQTFIPTEKERETFRQIQKAHQVQASSGLTVKETLAAIRDPRWRSDPSFYQRTDVP